MDINQLYYFTTVCEELNYTKASERLYISRQALVKSIHKLEEEFGYPLFYVAKNKISLAPFGQHLLTQGKPIVDAFRAMNADLVSSFEEGCRKIPVHISHSILPFTLPQLPSWLADFQTDYPEIPLEISEFDDGNLYSGKDLADGLFLVLRMPAEFPDAFQLTLQSKPLLLHLNASHPLAAGKEIRLEALGDALFCSPGDPILYFKSLNEAYQAIHGHPMRCRLIPDGGAALNAVRNNELISLGINFSDSPQAQSVPFSTKLIPVHGHDFLWNVELICRPEYAAFPFVQILIKYLERCSK